MKWLKLWMVASSFVVLASYVQSITILNRIKIAFVLPQIEREILNITPEKGKPFPTINGPQPSNKVCVVGAGPAGVHMALSLKKQGYEDVTIYEKTGFIGGKSLDVEINGKILGLGAAFVVREHFQRLIPMARAYDAGELLPIALQVMVSNDGKLRVDVMTYFLQEIRRITGLETNDECLLRFLEDVRQYTKVHKEMFGTFEGDLMQKPDRKTIHRMRGTFLDFMKRENLITLEPLFKITHTMQGYGYLDEVGAQYGLMWNKPRMFLTMFAVLLEKHEEPNGYFVLKKGYMRIWTNIVEKENLDVRLFTDITRVERQLDKHILEIQKDSETVRVECDWLVWAAPAKQLTQLLLDMEQLEHDLLCAQTHTYAVKTAVLVENELRLAPYTHYVETVNRRLENFIMADLSPSGLKIPGIIKSGVLEKEWVQKKHQRVLKSAYTMKEKNCTVEQVRQEFRNHYEQIGGQNIEFRNTTIWEYFPRWSPEDLQYGPHYQVFKLQGTRNMWYAGSSVCFESVKSVMEYNNLLLKQAGLKVIF